MKKSYDILKLKPTQFAVGMLEVDVKIKELASLSRKKLRRHVAANPIPVVVAPHGDLYLVDHHHFLLVCWHLGVGKVRVKVIADLSAKEMSFSQFWRWMHKKKYVYPYCQFGEGPREPLYLPTDIRGLADDPYRSLAWFVRKGGGFENTDKNFAEFRWANFFREHRLLNRHGREGFAEALKKAMKLARSPKAKDLPGFDHLAAKQAE